MIQKEITDRAEAMNILYGIDDGSVEGRFIKLIVKVKE